MTASELQVTAMVLVAAYAAGATPFGYLAGKLKGIDIREHGSGNIGATNVIRVLGKGIGIPVFVVDMLKGLVPVVLGAKWAEARGVVSDWPAIAGAAGAVLGHNFTFWLGFRGGKGIATSAGALMALLPVPLLVALGAWLAVFFGTRYVALASIAAAVVIGCGREETAKELQAFLTLPWFRTYTSDDVIGIEWGGAVKNVFAIAAGIAEGLGLGDNARAALVTRGLAEMTRLGTAAGGRFETFQGLSGVGDLIVTCYSSHSRNHRVGRQLGEGKSLPEIIAGMNMVAEGVPNTESIHEAARRYGVRTPIIDQMYSILYGGKPCGAALKELLARDPRPELS